MMEIPRAKDTANDDDPRQSLAYGMQEQVKDEEGFDQ